MKIMLCKYGEKEYKEITIKDLEYRLKQNDEFKKQFGVFIIDLDDIRDNTLYFSELDAYDY